MAIWKKDAQRSLKAGEKDRANMKILGIETSCDETAAAIVTDTREILSNVIHSQIDEHSPYGGVVPEIASRAHIQRLDGIIQQAMAEASCDWKDIDAIAATAGPGLIGGVIVGVMQAKALASALNKPFLAINHLEGHALTVRLSHNTPFPYLLLLVSGGHCQLLSVQALGKYELIGETLDDAVGESFDKLAKMLGLGLPGGPKVEELARNGDRFGVELPRPLLGQDNCNFSFSGLKTAVKRIVDSEVKAGNVSRETICASFQQSVAEILCDRLKNAFKIDKSDKIIIAGGVAANQFLRANIEVLAKEYNRELVAPPLHLCTDNAAMIAWAGIEKMQLGMVDNLDFNPKARWPLSA